MAYCTLDDLKMELRNFDQLVPVGQTEATWAAHMIKKASAYIDMRLNRKYGNYIPFDEVLAEVPEAIWALTIQLAVFYCLMSNFAGQSLEKLQGVIDVYWKPAIEQLNWISKGNLELPEIDGADSGILIDSTSDEYRAEFRLPRDGHDGTPLVEGSWDDA